MATRRQHTKSRKGCLQCKKLKVKCDEQHPKCTKCQIRHTECNFPVPGALSWLDDRKRQKSTHPVNAVAVDGPSSNDESNFLRNALDDANDKSRRAPTLCEPLPLDHEALKLIINWFTSTIHTIAMDDKTLRTIQTTISDAAMSNDFLMHAILAVSALHLASHGEVSENEKYSDMALLHHCRGLSLYLSALRKIDASNYVGSIAFSSIIILSTVALARPSQANRTKDLITELLSVFRLIKGWHEILKAAESNHPSGRITLREPPEIVTQKPDSFTNAMDHLHNLNTKSMHTTSKLNTPVYTAVITSLMTHYRRTLVNPRDPSLAFSWANDLPHDFLILLEKEESLAMIIVAHFCILLYQANENWWLNGWGVGLFECIWHKLAPEARLEIQWIRDSFDKDNIAEK